MAGRELAAKMLIAYREARDTAGQEQARLTASICWLTASMRGTIKLYDDMEYGAKFKSEDRFILCLKRSLTAVLADDTTIADGTAETGANGEESKGHLNRYQKRKIDRLTNNLKRF